MTREEAIKKLKSKLDGNTDTSYEWCECVRLAIKALEQQPCEDCVKREDVKSGMIKYGFLAPDMTVTEFVENLPSVTPSHEDLKEAYINGYDYGVKDWFKAKTGHWIDTGSGQMCSRCNEIQYGYDNFRRFCASCGAKMEVEE